MNNLAFTGIQTSQAFRAVYAYQWFRAGVALPGAINSTYIITSLDVSQQLQVLMTPTSGFTLPTVGMIGLSQESSVIGNSGLFQVGQTPFTGNLNYQYNSANETFLAFYIPRVEDVGQTLIAFVPDNDFPGLLSFPPTITSIVVTEPVFMASANLVPTLRYTISGAVGSFQSTGSVLTSSKKTLAVALGSGSFVRTGHTLASIKGLAENTGIFATTGPAIAIKSIIHMALTPGVFIRTGNPIFFTKVLVATTLHFNQTGSLVTTKVSHTVTASSGAFAKSSVGGIAQNGRRLIDSLGTFGVNGSLAAGRFAHSLVGSNGVFAIGFGPFNLTDHAGNILVDHLGHPLTTEPYHLIFGFGLVDSKGIFAETGKSLIFKWGLPENKGTFFGAGNSVTGVWSSTSFLAPAASPASPLTDNAGNILTDTRGG